MKNRFASILMANLMLKVRGDLCRANLDPDVSAHGTVAAESGKVCSTK